MTDDGSHTLFIPSLGEHYHSTFGALAESEHVFLRAGIDYAASLFAEISLLEVGFGTGLNALLAFIRAAESVIPLHYTGIEPFPVNDALLGEVSPVMHLTAEKAEQWWHWIHSSAGWDERMDHSHNLSLRKWQLTLKEFSGDGAGFNLVFFDSFAPAVQPELWTPEAFAKLAGMMVDGGVLVTYSSKGEVRRNLASAGFRVEKLPGPNGKREMVRAIRK